MAQFSSVDEVLDLSTQKTFGPLGKNRISAKTVTIPSPTHVPAFQTISEDLERRYGEIFAESQKIFPLNIPWSEKVQERHTRIVNAFLAPYGTFGSIFFPPRFQEELCLDLSKPTRTRSATPDDIEGQRAVDGEKTNTFRFASTGKIRRRKRKAVGEPTRNQKSLRKLVFEDESTPPVSGTIIVGPDDPTCQNQASADIDPALNLVEVTEEARAELARIENKIGDYICRLCKLHYNDAFALAQHRCSRIVHLSYVCSECDKVFNCPANLASHRRWHQPRGAMDKVQNSGERKQKAQKTDLLSDSQNNNAPPGLTNGLPGDYRPHTYTCWRCFKAFSLLVDLHRHNCSFGNFSVADQKFLPLAKRIEI